MSEVNNFLECPCCGDAGAVPNARGLYWDGQPLLCGCYGSVSCDSETDPWINDNCSCAGDGYVTDWPQGDDVVWNDRARRYEVRGTIDG